MRFRDRHDAGRRLAEAVRALQLDRPVVVGLPRGGVPVAHEVAEVLGAPLDVLVARKLGAPGQPEYGIGAIAEGGATVIDNRSVAVLGVGADELRDTIEAEARELARRVARYRGTRPLLPLRDADVVLVDDGLATGVSAEAALRALRAHEPRRLVLAVPVGTPDTVARLAGLADDVVCPSQPPRLRAVSEWYDVFDQTGDAEVEAVLAAGATRRAGGSAG